ncbi:MAG TPA: sensor histidine kinase [Ktedonobacterales bacterium]|nr:sensor histidine kinase [Ktedonobacterales bacterium]
MRAQHNVTTSRGSPSHPWATTEYVVRTLGLPLVLIALVTAWAFWGPGSAMPNSPPQAMLILSVLTLGTALFVRASRQRFGLDARAGLTLPDPLYTLYLATVVLAGNTEAIVLALITPLIAGVPDAVGRPRSILQSMRQSAAAGTTTLVAGLIYVASAAPFRASANSQLHAHIVGAVLASAVMFAGAVGFRLVEQRLGQGPKPIPWKEYLTTPALRFQLMMLVIGPLLPLAEVLDDFEAEVSWLLFLVPLSAIYYLALVSVRLQQRTEQLQETVLKLGQAREREADLIDYAALITSAQEEERRRLSRDLHDDTAQTLVALSRGLDALSSRRPDQSVSEHDTRFIAELGDLAKRSLDSIRRACQDLRPSVLDDLGLAAALASLANSMTQRGLECEFQQEGESSQPSAREVEVTVYRIAQEALANASRHADATGSKIVLAYDDATLRLTVSDNGHGFPVTETLSRVRSPQATGTGLGLRGMRERAGLINARLTIESVPESGTTITLTAPLGAPQARTAPSYGPLARPTA